ncbi:MAG: glutamate--tRNA ligase [Gemmatimonadales bacterium]|nr:MAG: glutamate--tRNA ligase [Gemmatimonadales bacterium]
MTLRVRFAPSPTGYLHVGGARTALFNWLLARREGGVFILRIEDTDRHRSSDEMTTAILEGMRWLGLDWDEGPHFQSEGVERHRAQALRLLDEGKAYRDFVSPEELAEVRQEDPARALRYPRERAEAMGGAVAAERAAAGEPFAIRFRVPDGETSWEDRVHGETRFDNATIEDLVILRADGSPTYNLAVVSDDGEMEITLVIRGDDHISNTPKQILLHRALGQPVPDFAHVPMILGPDGKRLSKRHGATAVGDYAGQGILPEAMVNFLALLGWSAGDDEQIFTREELVDAFSLDRVLRKSAVFDQDRLDWLNGRHLTEMDPESLLPELLGRFEGDRALVEDKLAEDREGLLLMIRLLRDRARSLNEIAEQAQIYLSDELSYDDAAVRKRWLKNPVESEEILEGLHEVLAGCEWTETGLESAVRAFAESREMGAGKVIHPLRVALTGQMSSPGIFEVLVVLGRERSLERIRRGLARIRQGETYGS